MIGTQRLAVRIPYHGESELLEECLPSQDASGAVPDEVLVFDDASETPPPSRDCYPFPVRIVRSDRNVGPALARNQLAALTACEYVHFHDADDLFVATWTERMQDALDRDRSCDAIFCEAWWIRTGSRRGSSGSWVSPTWPPGVTGHFGTGRYAARRSASRRPTSASTRAG